MNHPAPIAIDTEFVPSTEQEPVGRLVSVAMSDGNPNHTQLYHANFDRSRWIEVVAWALSGPGAVFHFAAIDVFTILRAAPELLSVFLDAYQRGGIYCTQNRSKLLDIARGIRARKHNLGVCAERYTGRLVEEMCLGEPYSKRVDQIVVDKSDPWRMHYALLLPYRIEDWPEDARRYASHDPFATWHVFQGQDREAAAENFPVDVFQDSIRQIRKSLVLYSQTLRGMHTDQRAVSSLDLYFQNRINTAAHELLRHGLVRWVGVTNPKLVKDTKAAKRMLSAHVGYDCDSLAEEALEDAALPADHPLRVYQDYGSALSQRSGWVTPFRNPIVRCRYDETKATGRTGSSEPGAPFVGRNLQNIPKPDSIPGVRECLVPAPGMRFGIADYGQQELVTFSQVQLWLFGRSKMAEAFRAGADPHTLVAARFLGIDPAQFDKRIPEHKSARDLAKIYNFGKLGAMGSERFRKFARGKGIEISAEEDREYTRTWKEQWSVDEYFAYHKMLIGYGDTGTIVQQMSNRIRGGCFFTDACNQEFQGGGADMSGDSMWRIFLASFDPASSLYAGPHAVDPDTGRVPVKGLVLHVHDENVIQAPAAEAQIVVDEMAEHMVASGRVWCPDVPIKVDAHTEERYTK